MNLPAPSLTVEYVLALATAILSLFLTQGLIDNSVAKFITGLASILVPLVLTAIQGYVKAKAHTALVAAAVGARIPVKPTGTPTS